MRVRWKKSLAALMALAMMLSLCVIPAGAEEVSGIAEKPVAQVTVLGNTIQYETLQAAIEAVPDNVEAEIQMLADITTDLEIEIGKNQNITLDLSGHKIESTLVCTENNYTISNYGILTINDTKGSAIVYNSSKVLGLGEYVHDTIRNFGTLTINGGTFGDQDLDQTNANDTNYGAAVRNVAGSCTVNGGYFTCTDNNGTWENTSKTAFSYAIRNGATMTINGGTVYGKMNGGIASDTGTVTIEDVTVSVTGTKSYACLAASATGGTFIVKGGVFTKTGNNYPILNSFSGMPSWDATEDLLNNGYTITGGTYTVNGVTQSIVPVAQVGDKQYGTLSAAVAAADASDTITLQRDIELTEPIVIDKSVTIEGDSHSITGAAKSAGNNRQGLFHLWNENDTAVSFTLRNADLHNLSGTNKWSSPCGISVRASNQTVNLENVTMDTSYYCVFVGVPDSENEDVNDVVLNIKDSSLTGYSSVYYRTNSTTNMIMRPVLNVVNSTLYGRGVSGYGNGFGTIVYNGTRNARTTIEKSTLSNVFGATNADADQGVIQFNSYGAYEKDAQVTIRNSTIKTANNSTAPNVIKYVCTQNINVGNKVIIDQLTLTRGETGTDLIRVIRNSNELVATGIDLKEVLELEIYDDSTWEKDADGNWTVEVAPLLQGDETILIPLDTNLSESAEIPSGVTVTVAAGAVLTVAADTTLTGQEGSKLIVNGSVSGLTDVTRTGTYNWQNNKWVRDNSGDYTGGGSTTTPPKTETETKTEGDVTTKTETTTTTNKDGSKTTETKETATNAATGEKTEVKATETVAKDGSVTKEEIKTTTAADGTKTEEKVSATVDAKTGTSTTATVKTDAAGKSAAEVVIENSKDAKTVFVSADAVKTAAKADEVSMTVKTAGTAITLDAGAVAAIAAAEGDKVSIAVETVKPQALPQAAQEMLKDAVVVDLAITVGESKVASFNGGTATVAVPYTKADSTKAVAVFYVAEDGKLTRMPGAAYDEAARSVTFTTGHFSYYAVMEETALPYTDVKDSDWYYDAVRYVTGAKLFNGTSDTTFGPAVDMTREMLSTVLYRQAGSPAVSGMALSEFSDSAAISDWAGSAMLWAVEQGILTGKGDARLAPADKVTRQELAAILYRLAGSPEVGGMALGEFSDSGNTADWAADAVLWAVQEGILTGKGGGILDPAGTATRAEVAAILMRSK